MRSKIKYSLIEILVAIFMFLLVRPSITWTWDVLFIHYGLLVLMAVQFDFNDKHNIPLFIFLFLSICIVPIAHDSNIIGVLATAMMAFIPFARKESSLRSFELFKQIVVAVLTISIVVWFVVLVFQVPLPYSVIEPLNVHKDHYYQRYPFLVLPMDIKDFSVIRFCCVFDEAGVVGTMSLLFLYIGDFKLKRFDNIVFLVAGLISFSLFFYLGFVIFLLIKVFLNRELKRYRIASIVLVAGLFFTILTVPFLNDVVGYRFKFDEDKGTITGNNRSTDELDDYVASIRGTNLYYWGDPKGEEEFLASASLQNAVLRYGVVYLVLFFIFFFFYAQIRMHNNWKEIAMFMLLLILTLFQRPGFLVPTYLYMFSSVVQSRQMVIEEKRLRSGGISSQRV